MKTMSIGDLQTHFSEAVEYIESGEKIGITDDEQTEIKALLISKEEKLPQRKLGILKGEKYFMSDDFSTTTQEEFEL